MASQGRGEGRARTVLSMVWHNRPWWLVTDLYSALAAALGTAAFSVVTSTIWPLGDRLDWPRLLAIGVVAVVALGVWIVVAHGLWERSSSASDPERVRVANAVTALTLLVGLACFYLALFALALLSALLIIDASYLGQTLGHPVDFGDYATLAWMTASLATVGGALGSGLETDQSVRDALYRYRPQSLADQEEPGSPA
jgi:hypothetical protein